MPPQDALPGFFESTAELIDIQGQLTPHISWLLQHGTPTPGLKKIVFQLFHHLKRVHRGIVKFFKEYQVFRDTAVRANKHDIISRLEAVAVALVKTEWMNEVMRTSVRELLIERWSAYVTVCVGKPEVGKCFCRDLEGVGEYGYAEEICVCSWFGEVSGGPSSESSMSSASADPPSPPPHTFHHRCSRYDTEVQPLLDYDDDDGGEIYLTESCRDVDKDIKRD